jgi:UDP-N-acetylmuramoylalanine--D-glutamate ligase
VSTALVYGLGIAGQSVTRALRRRDVDVVAVDDDLTAERAEFAAATGCEVLVRPTPADLADAVASVDLVVPSPGVPESHPVIELALAHGRDVVSEIELAYRWEQERPDPRPMLAVTGTDGKTTTTLLTVAMLQAAGVRTIDAGNTATPLVDAIELDVDAFVVECTSFRLAWTTTFRADGAAWLNLAPDHLDWHRSRASYEAAKAKLFAHQRADDVAIGFVEDAVVMDHLRRAPARHVTFGSVTGDYHSDGSHLVGPRGRIAPVDELARSLPHDLTNACAASALVLEVGLADADAVAQALRSFRGPRHRLSLVGTHDGVSWYDDSKATTPHAAATAIRAFERVVLIAGGYDKGVDLSPMAVDQDRVVAVVAIGATAATIERIFDRVPVVAVAGLDEAVPLAASLGTPGDVVLLSPGCASFDQYTGFEARGDHFQSLVEGLMNGDRP